MDAVDSLTSRGEEVLRRVAGVDEGSVPRLLVVLAHADDEVLALGGRLERWSGARFLCVTDGAPRDGLDAEAHGFSSLEAYRTSRREELRAALAHAGLDGAQAQQMHLLASDGGGVVADQEASLCLAPLARAVLEQMRQFGPEAVLTHPYEGGHPDHDACAFAVHAALALRAGPELPIIEAPFYHAGSSGLVTGEFLAYPGAGREISVALSEMERANKRDRLACFASQRETLSQFQCETERYRLAPRYRFATAPHAGQLWYERWPWGMSGERFRVLAAEAAQRLGWRGERE